MVRYVGQYNIAEFKEKGCGYYEKLRGFDQCSKDSGSDEQ